MFKFKKEKKIDFIEMLDKKCQAQLDYIFILQERQNKLIDKMETEIRTLEHNKKGLLSSGKINPENGGIIADIDYHIKRAKEIINILKGEENEKNTD